MKEKGWMKKNKSKEIDEHRRRIQDIKPVTDCAPPRSAVSSRRREMMRHRHYAAIEFENKLMLERLALAMQRKTIDNNQPAKKANDKTRTKLAEMRRIDSENKLILKRILDAVPKYDHRKWEAEARQREAYLANLCEYPPQKSSGELGIAQVKWAQGMSSAPPRSSSASRGRHCPTSATAATFLLEHSASHTTFGSQVVRPHSANRTTKLNVAKQARPATAGTARNKKIF